MAWNTRERIVLALLCAAYAVSFSVRSVVGLATLDMTRDKSLGIDSATMSRLYARGTLGGAFGKLIGGALVDKLGGGRSMAAILATMGACFASLGKATGLSTSLIAAFVLSRAVHAAAWPATTLVIRDWFNVNNGQSFALSLGASSSRGGAWLGSLVGGILLARIRSWRSLLGISATVCGTFAAMTAIGLKAPQDQQTSDTEQDSSPRTESGKSQSTLEALKLGVRTPKLLLLYASNMLLTPSFDFGTLLPQYLSEEYALDDARIGSISGLFPLAAPPSILLGSMVLQRCSDRVKTAFLLTAEVFAVAGYLLLARRPALSTLTPAIATIMAGISPALYCVTPDYVLRWGGPYAGLFSGLSDVPGNLFTMAMYMCVPRLLSNGGWPRIMRIYALQVAMAACSLLGFRLLEAMRPTVGSPFVKRKSD